MSYVATRIIPDPKARGWYLFNTETLTTNLSVRYSGWETARKEADRRNNRA